ncbi:general substrate transporter [Aspergillus carlsbadensis]|nr:general substrate transporter [Aspergillus carlsbadensis]
MARHDQNRDDVPEAVAGVMPEGTIDPKQWWYHPNLRTMNLLMFFPLLSIFTLGFDGSMMNGLQAVEGWRSYFGEPRGATLGLFNGAYPIGGLVAVPFISTLNDHLGRRWGIVTGAIICIIGAALQGAAQNLAMFVVSRGIIGAGAVLLQASGGPLVAEIAHPKQRATATAMFNTSYALGSIVAAWTTFGSFRINNTWSWRVPSLLQGLPSLIQLVGILFVPESPRWLISRGREQDALKMLAKYHAEGNENDPLVQFKYQEIRQAMAIEKMNEDGHIFNNQMSGNAFISYYLSPILAQVGLTTSLQQTLINATSQMLSWFSSLYFATLPARVGRRKLFLAALILVFFCLIAITAGSGVFDSDSSNRSAGIAVVAFVYLFSPAYNLGLASNLGLYITEIVPFNLRLRGMAVFQFWNLGFILFSTFAIPIGLDAIGWRLFCVFVGWLVVEFVVVWWTFPETKGPTLEEIAVIFDGPSAAHGGGKDIDLETQGENKRDDAPTVEHRDY